MKNPTMLYKCPGPESFEGVACQTSIVEDDDVPAAKEQGWHANWIEADAAHKADLAALRENEQKLADAEKKLADEKAKKAKA